MTLLNQGQSVYVPLGVKHWLKNPDNLPLVIVGVQIDNYLGEGDIVRYEVKYMRTSLGRQKYFKLRLSIK